MWETKTFKTQKSLNDFVDKNKHKYQIVPIFINNGFGLEIKKNKVIDIQ